MALPAIGYDALCTFALLGAPLVVYSDLTGTPLVQSAQVFAKFLPVISTLIGFGMLWIVGGWKLIRKGFIPCLIAGLIKDRDNGIPMKGMITFPGSDVPGVVSDEMGKYLARLNPGEYKIHIYANGYRWIERKIQVKAGKDEKWDLTLKRKLGTIAGKVIDGASGLPLTATLQFVNARLPDLTSDGNSGEFTTLVPPGKYKLVAKADGYADKEIDLAIKDKENQTPQFVMSPAGMAPAAPAIETTVASLPPATASAEPRRPAPPPRPRPVRVTTPATTAAPAAVKPAAAKPAVSAKLTAADVAALYKTGVEQFMNEDYATAQSTFQKVLKSDPGNAKAKEYLGKTKDRLKKLKG